jgi:2-desacetyl-2-hydroxyethyl bacteriochlorophyllide A dehydrogenase
MSFVDALECSEPGTLRLVRRPAPVRGPGEILVRPRRVGICGTDYHIFEGKHPFLNDPRVMGHELAVEVVEAPENSDFSSGDIAVVNPYLSCGTCIACRRGKPNCCTRIEVLGVHRDGGMTELLSLPPANLVPSDGLNLDACAAVEFLAIGAHAVRRSRMQAGDHALVVGAGPIGLGAALFAARTGASLTIMDRDPERLASATAMLGSVTSIVADADADARIAELTGGDGYDIVLDATGNLQSIQAGFNSVAHGGTYVLISVVKGDISFTDAEFHRREMSLLGSRNAMSEDFSTVINAIRAGAIPVDALVTHRTSLADAADNLPRWAVQKQGLIKALIEL